MMTAGGMTETGYVEKSWTAEVAYSAADHAGVMGPWTIELRGHPMPGADLDGVAANLMTAASVTEGAYYEKQVRRCIENAMRDRKTLVHSAHAADGAFEISIKRADKAEGGKRITFDASNWAFSVDGKETLPADRHYASYRQSHDLRLDKGLDAFDNPEHLAKAAILLGAVAEGFSSIETCTAYHIYEEIAPYRHRSEPSGFDGLTRLELEGRAAHGIQAAAFKKMGVLCRHLEAQEIFSKGPRFKTATDWIGETLLREGGAYCRFTTEHPELIQIFASGFPGFFAEEMPTAHEKLEALELKNRLMPFERKLNAAVMTAPPRSMEALRDRIHSDCLRAGIELGTNRSIAWR